MPGYSGQQNQVDIMIQSQFNGAGFAQAKTAIAQLNSVMKNLTAGVGSLNTGMASTNKIAATGSQSFQQYANYANGVRSATQTAKESITGLGSGMTMTNGVIKSVNTSTATLGQSMGGMATVATNSSSTMGNAMNNMKGYMGSLVKQTISVGDVFGYYIGMVALQAVYDLTIGVSSLKNEMETTFEYMGNASGTVKDFSSNITDWAMAMPKISIAGSYEMSRVQAMGGAALGDIEKFKQTWGDMATITASLNNLSPEAAAKKIGPAIVDAVTGNYVRLKNVMGVTTRQFKDKAAELGFSNEDLAGNYANTMTVIQKILEERNLAGVAGKLTSFADAWDFMAESISGTASKAMGDTVSKFSPYIVALGNAIQNIPGPLLLMGLGLIGLIASILVAMPIIAALVTSFSIVTTAFNPLTSRLSKAKMAFLGYSKGINVATKDAKAAAEEFKKLDKSMGALDKEGNLTNKAQKYTKLSTPSGDIVRKVTFDIDDGPVARFYTKTNDGVNQLQKRFTDLSGKINGSGKEVDGFGNKIRNIGSTGSTQIDRLGGGFRTLGTGVKGAALGVGTLSKAMLLFMLTNPIGIILTLASAFLIIMTYTKSWGKLTGLLNTIMQDLGNILEPIVAAVVDLGTKGYNAIKQWGGWNTIAQFIKVAYDNIVGFAAYVNNLEPDARKTANATNIWGQQQEYVNKQVASLDSGGSVDGFAGTIAVITDRMHGLYSPLIFIMASITTLADLTRGWKVETDILANSGGLDKFNYGINKIYEAWNLVKQAFEENKGPMNEALGQLASAFKDIGDALNEIFPPAQQTNTQLGNTGDTAGKIQPNVSTLKSLFDSMGEALRMVAWVIKNVVVPGIRLFGLIMTGIVRVITFPILLFARLGKAMRDAGKATGPFATALKILSPPLLVVIEIVKTLWHWITGNSPGLIPAFHDLLAVASSVFPTMAAIISGAINSALQFIMTFVSNTVAWFQSLPGKIMSAIATISDVIYNEFKQAYDGAVAFVGQFYQIGVQIKDKVVSGIMGALNMGSPSKVTYGLGEMISQGLLNGMTDWVNNNTDKFAQSLKGNVEVGLKILQNAFKSFKYIFYYDSLQGVSKTLSTWAGNCSDAADAFMALASRIGIATSKIHTTVNGIGHYVVGVPGGWFDPSGILGNALHTGGVAASGAPNITIHQHNPGKEESADVRRQGMQMGRDIMKSLRFGI